VARYAIALTDGVVSQLGTHRAASSAAMRPCARSRAWAKAGSVRVATRARPGCGGAIFVAINGAAHSFQVGFAQHAIALAIGIPVSRAQPAPRAAR